MKPSFFETVQKMVRIVICISQGVIIFCAPNKTNEKKKKKKRKVTDAGFKFFIVNCLLVFFFLTHTHTLNNLTFSWTSPTRLHIIIQVFFFSSLDLFPTVPITCVLVQLATLFCIHS